MSASLRDSSHLGTSFLLCPTKLLDGHVGLDDAPSEPLLVEQEGGFALEPTKLFAHTCYCTLLPLLTASETVQCINLILGAPF